MREEGSRRISVFIQSMDPWTIRLQFYGLSPFAYSSSLHYFFLSRIIVEYTSRFIATYMIRFPNYRYGLLIAWFFYFIKKERGMWTKHMFLFQEFASICLRLILLSWICVEIVFIYYSKSDVEKSFPLPFRYFSSPKFSVIPDNCYYQILLEKCSYSLMCSN